MTESSGLVPADDFEAVIVTEAGVEHRVPWRRLPDVVDDLGRPVRSFPSYRGKRSFPGWYWATTLGGLVGFESWVERDHLVALDFDASVVGIVSQPFWLCWTPAGGKRPSCSGFPGPSSRRCGDGARFAARAVGRRA